LLLPFDEIFSKEKNTFLRPNPEEEEEFSSVRKLVK